MLLYFATKAGGFTHAQVNVELMPAGPVMAPVPFQSIGKLAQAKSGTYSEKVTIQNQPLIVKGTEIPMTTGDAPPGKGVVGGKSMGSAKVVGNVCAKVLVEGKRVAVQGSLVSMNQNNAPTGTIEVVAQNLVGCTTL
jgi:hypothetical protein